MLIFSKKRFYPTVFGVSVLPIKDVGYVYIDGAVLGAAYALQDRYGSLASYLPLFNVVNPTASQKIMYDRYLKHVQPPMDMLAPFLLLVEDWKEDDENGIDHLLGMLHRITASINVNTFINSPKEIRSGVKFYSRYDYQDGWDLITKEWISVEGYERIIADYEKEITQRNVPELLTWDEIAALQKEAIPKLLEQAKVQELLADWQTSRMRMELEIEKYKEAKGIPQPPIQILTIPGMWPNQMMTPQPQAFMQGVDGMPNTMPMGGNTMSSTAMQFNAQEEASVNENTPMMEENDGVITYVEEDDDADEAFDEMILKLTSPVENAPAGAADANKERNEAPTEKSRLDKLKTFASKL